MKPFAFSNVGSSSALCAHTAILPYASREAMKGQPRTPVTAVLYLRRLSGLKGNYFQNTHHTTVHPTLRARIFAVYGLVGRLRKLWAVGCWNEDLMLRRLRKAAVGRMMMLIVS